LAGHSMGGRIAIEVCRLAPDRVERLCLLSTEHRPRPSGREGEEETKGRLALLHLARDNGMRAMALAWIPKLVAEQHLGDAGLVERIVSMIERYTPEQLEAHIEAGHTRPDS